MYFIEIFLTLTKPLLAQTIILIAINQVQGLRHILHDNTNLSLVT